MGVFNPLGQIELPGCGKLDFDGLTLVVGPNSSGKTHLLRDIDQRVSGFPRRLVVAQRIVTLVPPDINEFVKFLEAEQHIIRISDGNSEDKLRPTAARPGQGPGAVDMTLSTLKSELNDFRQVDATNTNQNIAFLQRMRHVLVAGMFLETRLTMTRGVNTFDEEHQPPTTELQALFINEEARAQLVSEIRRTFGKLVVPDATKPNLLVLRVSDDPNSPPPEHWHSPKRMRQYRTIDDEGDGLKSYVGICMGLLLGRTLVTIIDEPELCLHPPQAYNLGRFIGRAASPERKTIVATHSSHFLRGVMNARRDFQIIRLTRSGKSFAAHRIEPDLLATVLQRPSVVTETILDGIFADAVLVVEAESDRVVYQAAFESLTDGEQLDIHFAGVGGVGGIAETCRLYRKLRIPIAVIVDFDVLCNPDRLTAVVKAMADVPTAEEVLKRLNNLCSQLNQLGPSITPASLDARFCALVAMGRDWSNEDDLRLRQELTTLAKELDRMRDAKAKGLDGLPIDLRGSAVEILGLLRQIGVFVVPVGELEGWLQSHGITVSTKKKWEWAIAAAAKVRELGVAQGDVWDFASAIVEHLRKNA